MARLCCVTPNVRLITELQGCTVDFVDLRMEADSDDWLTSNLLLMLLGLLELEHLLLGVVQVPFVGHNGLHLPLTLHVAVDVNETASRACYRLLVLLLVLHLLFELKSIDVW